MTQSEKRHLEALWRDGVTIKNIARIIGYSEETVLAYACINRDKCPYRKKQVSKEVRDEWVDRIRSGQATIRQAVETLGVHKQTVKGWLKRMP